MIPVTKTYLPSIEEYNIYLKKAWDKGWITNRGELVVELEKKLKEFLNVQRITITTNGTIPLQIAVKLLGKQGEIITTPFSYVATTSAIVWENCIPVFVDIHPEYLTIDETQIEAAITPRTTAIMATHVFGNPCHTEKIEAIAKKHNLSVIYDGAHCFGVKYMNRSIFDYGDISTCSFHATKLFHCGEGGAIFCKDEKLFQQSFHCHNFGHKDALSFHGLGINGKISELQAAMGLSVLPYMKEIFSERKKVIDFYNIHIKNSAIRRLRIRENTEWNYSYYPIILESETELLRIEKLLNQNDIFPRRYFYPSLNTIDYTKGKKMPVSESIAERILCLPLYVGLKEEELTSICNLVSS